MIKFHIFCLLALFGLRHTPCLAQVVEHPLQYELLSSDLGLSQNLITSLLQDRQGFLWVGTKEGLNRFDGYHFVNYHFDPFDSLSISGNHVLSLVEDRAGRLWVWTIGGLNLFDREQEVFYHIRTPGNATGNNCFAQDRLGNLWLGTDRQTLALLTLPPESRHGEGVAFQLYPPNPKNPADLPRPPAWDAAGRGLMYGMNGVFQHVWFDSLQQKFRFDQDFEAFTQPALYQFLTAQRKDNTILRQGLSEKIWLVLSAGLGCWDSRNNRYTEIPGPPNTSNKRIEVLLEDSRKRVWTGGYGQTLRLDTERGEWLDFSPKPQETTHPLFYGVETFLEDQGGLIWIGTRGAGLLKYNDYSRRFEARENDPGLVQEASVRCLFKSKTGRIWVGPASGGLCYLDPGDRTFTLVTDIPKTGLISGMLEDQAGVLWIATSNGLLKYWDWQTPAPRYKWFDFRLNPDAPTGVIWSTVSSYLLEDPGKGLWFACQDALRHFDPQTEQFETYPFFGNDTRRIYENSFPTLFRDRRGIIWAGLESGLWRFDPANKSSRLYQTDPKNPNSLSQNVVKCITEDPAEPLRYCWVGTGGGGLNRLDLETGTFEKLTEKDGLPNMVVYGILPDEAGNLWLSTNRGLSVFDPRRRVFRNFDERDGLQSLEFNTCAFHKAYDGQLFFGGIKGFNAFYPAKMLQSNPHVPNIVFTDFKIANKSVSSKTPGSPLSTAIAYTRKIVLPHDVKIISFDFAALDFADPSKNQFSCKMEGFDKDWQYLGKVHSATYTNLGPGAYTFRVRGANNDGVWNEAGASIEIVILAPWWATWWAYTVYFLVVGAVFYAFSQLQNKRNQAKAETARLQELNEAKSQFLNTVSHEFRTPLTSILGFTKIIQKRMEERLLPKLDRTDAKTDAAATQVMDNLGIVVSESERLTALINEVLDLAKIESGKTVWQEEKLLISDLIDRALAATESLFRQKRLRIQKSVEPGLPPTIGAPDRLQQVLVNLLSNAVKFTDHGTVTCTARRLDDALLISVADTGIGVPEAYRQVIFEKFKQVAGDTLTDKPRGTGLGLAICKEIVERHGGRIWVESDSDGPGSVFRFTLPIR